MVAYGGGMRMANNPGEEQHRGQDTPSKQGLHDSLEHEGPAVERISQPPPLGVRN